MSQRPPPVRMENLVEQSRLRTSSTMLEPVHMCIGSTQLLEREEEGLTMTGTANQAGTGAAATALSVNGSQMSIDGVTPHTTTLQWLRSNGITGPKEG